MTRTLILQHSVALVASRLFGTQVTGDAVIGESLERATDPVLKLKTLGGDWRQR
jgi:hypothetical protein